MSGARPWLRSESMRSLTAASADRDHAALARRELLVGVEAEDRRVAARADRARRRRGRRRAPRRRPRRSAGPSALEGRAGRPGSRRCGPAAARVVRSVTAAAAASRVEVQRDAGRCRRTPAARARRATALALATNENGEVTTSSPSLHARPRAARGAGRRCRSTPRSRARRRAAPRTPARRPARAGRARAGPSAGPRGPRASSSAPRTGCASGISSVGAHGAGAASAASPRGAAPAPGLLGVLQRVDERLPGGRDDVLVDADRAPHVVAVGGVDEHARRPRRCRGPRRGCGPCS